MFPSDAKENYALVISYDGSDFAGFQSQPGRTTVQQSLEAALAAFVGRPVPVRGASRTDAGVHARAQVVSFKAGGNLDLEALTRGLNTALAPRIAVVKAARASGQFHARWSAVGKTYVYRLMARPDPEARAAPVGHPRFLHGASLALDEARLRAALAKFPGTGTYRGVCGRGPVKQRQVRRADMTRASDGTLELWFEGSSFGRFMVRNLTGLAVATSMGLFPLEAVGEAIQGHRQLRGLRAPPQGLTLWAVEYPPPLSPFADV